MSLPTFTTQRQLMQKNMPASALDNPFARQQKMLMYVLPLFFAISGVNFPIGVLIYWLTTNVWSMGQQFYVIRRMPAPGSQAERELEARRARKAGKTPTTTDRRRPMVTSPGADGRPGGRTAPAAEAQPAAQEAGRPDPAGRANASTESGGQSGPADPIGPPARRFGRGLRTWGRRLGQGRLRQRGLACRPVNSPVNSP